ncbi:MAG: exodeoxyribonuclease III [Deltaproteobacteria bacterium]|nr:exodeoxyribonuclease III [Deltaproteobacteria bacterium]
MERHDEVHGNSGSWQVATFNVNGIRARLPLVFSWLRDRRPDVLCLQEIKCQERDFPYQAFSELGYTATVYGQKAFNGVAFLSLSEPAEVWRGFGDAFSEDEARIICGLFGGVWIVNTYVPQGRSPQDPAFRFKLDFFAKLLDWFRERFDPQWPVIWTGDLNVAPEPIDVYDPVRLQGEVGFHPDEQAALERVKGWGFVDLFRMHNPGKRQYTFWDYRIPKAFQRNLGWRLDHVMATRFLADRSRECRVDDQSRGVEKASDHAPVVAVFDAESLDATHFH